MPEEVVVKGKVWQVKLAKLGELVELTLASTKVRRDVAGKEGSMVVICDFLLRRPLTLQKWI
jgi:hypothetical protein